MKSIIALLGGAVMFVLLLPASVQTSDPPRCFAMLFYPVPCAEWVAPLAGVATAGLARLGLWLLARRQ